MLGGEPPHPVGVDGFPAHFDRRVPSRREVRIPSELEGGVAPLVRFARLPVGRVGGPGLEGRGGPDVYEMNCPVGVDRIGIAFAGPGVALRARLTFSFAASPLLGILVGHGLLRPLPWGVAGQLGRVLVGLGHRGGPEPGLHWALSAPPQQRPGECEPEHHRGGPAQRRRFGRVGLIGPELLGTGGQ